jgi:hypothetical protein
MCDEYMELEIKYSAVLTQIFGANRLGDSVSKCCRNRFDSRV